MLVGFMILREKAALFLTGINHLRFVIATQCVFFDTGNGFVNITYVNFGLQSLNNVCFLSTNTRQKKVDKNDDSFKL
jgi:hypothetical protein